MLWKIQKVKIEVIITSSFIEAQLKKNEQGKTYRRTHGTVEMDPQESIASTNRQTAGSGMTTKRNVTGSDYDGQVSGE